MFNVVIIGGEKSCEFNYFRDKCIYFLRNKAKEGGGITIYTTGNEYVDKFAKMYGIDVRVFYTDWKRDKKNALVNRNTKMLSDANALIYFDDGIKDNSVIYNMAVQRNINTRKVSATLPL